MANQIDIITTSLEALIQRATNVSNQGPDRAAIDAFCGLINKEPECVQMAVKFITAKVHSLQEWEALQALILLETCMKRCGGPFHAEIGKFRFLNELIKLVSPKYLGAHTPKSVRRRVLELMFSWTMQYPRETKIKEAYDMLKKQGVVQEEPPCPVVKESNLSKQAASILQDEETSQLLQKLLQSKNPQDLQAANKLIKSMVKEEERRVEEKWRYKLELQKVVNNCSLLNEMLNSYQVGVTSEQELELIKELHTSCQNLRPVLFKLANANYDEAFCTEVLAANDDLGDVFTKYNNLIVEPQSASAKSNEKLKIGNCTSLLDLTPSPSKENLVAVNSITELGGLDVSSPLKSNQQVQLPNHLDTLREVFTEIIDSPLPSSQTSHPSSYLPTSSVAPLAPLDEKIIHANYTPLPSHTLGNGKSVKEPSKSKGFEELDIISETLLKQSLSKKPQSEPDTCLESVNNTAASTNAMLLDDDLLLSLSSNGDNQASSNDLLSDLSVQPDQNCLPETNPPVLNEKITVDKTEIVEGGKLRPLGDIKLSLTDVKPSSVPPFQILSGNNISIAVHLAKDCPKPEVSVFVVTITSKNETPLDNFLFQPVVPKHCRLRLLPPSSTNLPAHNPFLPPSIISQLMLIASPTKEPIILKYVVSYTMEEETITEMGEIEELLMKEK